MSLFGLGKSHNLRHYSNAYVFVNGTRLTQESSVTIEKKGNASPKFTLGMGFAGLSLGAGTAEVSIDNAVPSADIEFADADLLMRIGADVEIGVVMGGRQTIFKGFITDVAYAHSVNDASKMSVKLICRHADFE